MYLCCELGFGPALPNHGCVVCPGVPRGFGFFRNNGPAFAVTLAFNLGVVRALLALLSAVALAWGSLYGHIVECIAAVFAAVLVHVVGGVMRPRKEG